MYNHIQQNAILGGIGHFDCVLKTTVSLYFVWDTQFFHFDNTTPCLIGRQ